MAYDPTTTKYIISEQDILKNIFLNKLSNYLKILFYIYDNRKNSRFK